jgi:hypothetical protein
MAILAEWQSHNSYDLRVRHLRGQASGGLNGTNLLTWGPTVLDDSSQTVQNQLTAAVSPQALDWFFVGAFDSYHNYENGEAFNNGNHP